MTPSCSNPARRRRLLAAALAWFVARPAMARDDLAARIEADLAGAPVGLGKVDIDIAPRNDDPDNVPITVTVDSPMTAEAYVQSLAIYTELDPQGAVAQFELGARAGHAQVSLRLRLARSQKVAAVARLSDGTIWSATVDAVVAPAAATPALPTAPRAIVTMPRTAQRDDRIEIRTQISHPMEPGGRVDAAGEVQLRDIVTRFECRYGEVPVFAAMLSSAIAADPYLAFYTLATDSDTLSFRWEGDHGYVYSETVTIKVD